MDEINLDLPFPPSVNRIWRQYGKKVLISKEYRTWKVDAKNMLQAQYLCMENPAWLADKLAVEIYLQPGDHRKWDVDNRSKAVLDALEGIWFADDSQIDYLSICRLEKDFPACWVRLFPMRDIEIQRPGMICTVNHRLSGAQPHTRLDK